MKKITSLILAFVMIVAIASPVMAQDVNFSFENGIVEIKVNPLFINSKTMVPLRAIFEAFESTVEWDDRTQSITITRYGPTVVLPVGAHVMYLDGEAVPLDTPAIAEGGVTKITIKNLLEAFGMEVEWNDITGEIVIKCPWLYNNPDYSWDDWYSEYYPEYYDDVPTLTWYLPGNKQADTALVCEEINKIIEPKIGAKIDIQYIASSDFAERMRLIMASQEEFDLCFTGFNNKYVDGVRRGGFMEITDLLNEYGPELKEVIPDYLWEAANVNGELYAIPTYQAMTKCRAAYFDKNLVDKYGFDVSSVKKMEDIVPFLEKIRDNEKGNFFPAQCPSVEYFYEDAYRYEDTSIDYIKLDSVTGEVIFQYDNPEIQNARKQIKAWRDAGFFPPVGSLATQNQCAVWFTDGYRPGDVRDREISRGTPIVAAQLSDFMIERISANTTMTSISATSRYPEKAMQFLVEVNTNPDVFNLCAYGIEGKHYKKTGENHIEFIVDSGYAPGGNWKYGVLFNGYLLEGYADDLWEQIKAVNDNSRKAKLLGFVADTTPVVINISQIASSLSEFKSLQDGSTTNLEADTAAFEKKMLASGKEELVEYAKKVIGWYWSGER